MVHSLGHVKRRRGILCWLSYPLPEVAGARDVRTALLLWATEYSECDLFTSWLLSDNTRSPSALAHSPAKSSLNLSQSWLTLRLRPPSSYLSFCALFLSIAADKPFYVEIPLRHANLLLKTHDPERQQMKPVWIVTGDLMHMTVEMGFKLVKGQSARRLGKDVHIVHMYM